MDGKNIGEHYDVHAAKYNAIQRVLGSTDPALIKDVILEVPEVASVLSNPDHLVIDFGCGTGLEGKELRSAGFKKIIGLDASKEMLNNVPDGIYDEKANFFLGKDEVPEHLKELADLVTASGVLVCSHVPVCFIEAMLAFMKKGGYFVFNGRDSIF
mmetsp:Transcript_18804/g.13628  ORF Transcript_18804/g.13628 Transcript_18804/m.13628 type:complete len:156 (+) Transcript_18804:90-557(+)